jgi:hypothetical protein
MSQGMTRKLPINGFGTCVTYGEANGMGIGLPLDIDEDRPIVVAHPAAASHYHASMSLFEDAGHPFLQVLVDAGMLHVPDEWPYHADVINHAIYQRLNDSSEGWPVYRKTSLATPHWQLHVMREAYEFLSISPAIDVLYVDWLSWLDGFVENRNNAFPEMMAHIAHTIRDGGLVILDHKHVPTDEYGPCWYNHPGGEFPVTESTSMSEVCTIEWLGENANHEMQTYSATVFKVHHHKDGALGDVNWFDAIKPWFWNTILEMALMPSQVQTMLDEEHEETVHSNAITWENWHDTWSTVYMDGREHGLVFKTPVPARFAWPEGGYLAYLQWLLDHAKCLPEEAKKKSYRLKNEHFHLNIVYGDLITLAPSLHSKHSALAVRHALQQQVVGRCPWWKHQTTVLQTKETWMSNPIVGLKWSGPSATPHLAKHLIQHSKAQAFGVTMHTSKSFDCREVITVAHGTAQLTEVMAAVEAYYHELGFEAPRPIHRLELTVVSMDENEYVEDELPPQWRRVVDEE